MVSSTYRQIENNLWNWNYCMQCFLKSKYINIRTFNDKYLWIIKKVMVLKKLLPHLATRVTYSPGDWRCDEAWREQTLVYLPVMCQQRLSYCTWELNIMMSIMTSQITGNSNVWVTGCSGKPKQLKVCITGPLWGNLPVDSCICQTNS